ncbi:MAG: 2,3-bisphosphoglycerate-dependent phosphoglycerate mutase [Candidatus Parcubacteria bacterium]|jgi:broad specificity phosphatase PhoE|nr:2,3-bisphosphoglycerate-dependent phosphoglycerate mutase [Candidatus Parcubacteria bacterium]
MKGYAIRHGQTQLNAERRMAGHLDIPLAEEGVVQARQAAHELPEGLTEIYSSDLLRCKQTTDILNEKWGLPIIFDARLRERCFGSLQGQRWEDADPTGTLWEADMNQQYDYRPYGGESVEDVGQRVLACIQDITLTSKGKPLLVTSGGVIRFLKNLESEAHGIIGNASIHEFEFPDSIR